MAAQAAVRHFIPLPESGVAGSAATADLGMGGYAAQGLGAGLGVQFARVEQHAAASISDPADQE